MSTYVVNRTGVLLKIQDYHIGDASSGWGYDGAIIYEIAHDGILLVDGSIFINETINQRKVLEVHVKSEGRETLILEHDVFERNEALIFMTGEDNKLTINHVPKDIASKTRFADRIWRMIIPYTVSEADIEALIAAAKPWKKPGVDHVV